MTSIGLISDTHGWFDEQVFKHFEACDEIWHAGDFGDEKLVKTLADFKPLKGVFGNIDGPAIQQLFPERLSFSTDGLKVCMQHIGGYPGKYAPRVKDWLKVEQPHLFISGHSHILKIMPDNTLNLLHINPGAAGHQGWHQMRTIVRFQVSGSRIQNLEVIELGLRGKIM